MAISAEDKNFLVSLYVGYFNRAPDPAGLQFWIDQVEAGRDTNTIAADFAASPEAKSLYPFLTTPDVSSPTSFITAVYANLFNRAPDAAGQAFWEAQLSSGAVSPADAIDAIIKGATTAPDSTILANKNVVGLDFATDAGNTPGFTFDLGGASGSAAKDAISGVTEDSATVTAAQAATDAYLSGVGGVAIPGQTFTLTTTVGENVLGGAGNDTFSASVDAAGLAPAPGAGAPSTLNATDMVDGAGGTDTINIIGTSGAAAPVPAGAIKNVEIVNLISDVAGNTFAAGAGAVGTYSGVQQLWQINAAAPIGVTGVTDAVTVGFNATAALNDLQMATGATTANVALMNVATGGTINIGETTAGTLTTANVNGSVAGAGALTIDLDTVAGTGGVAATKEATVNLGLTGGAAAAPATVTVNSATAKTIDASTSTGHLNIVGAHAAVETLKGGSGNDTLTGSAASKLIEGGAGADTITAGGVAGEVINGGANGTVTNNAAPPPANLFDLINLGANATAQTVLTESGHSGLTALTIDQVTGFVTGTDKLDFNLADGSATNFLAGGASSGVTDALTNANTAFDGTVQYFDTQVGADTLIFVDVDLDGTADMAIQLTGVGPIVAGDIIA